LRSCFLFSCYLKKLMFSMILLFLRGSFSSISSWNLGSFRTISLWACLLNVNGPWLLTCSIRGGLLYTNFQDLTRPNFKAGDFNLEAERKLSSGLKGPVKEFRLTVAGIWGCRIIGFVGLVFIISRSKKAKFKARNRLNRSLFRNLFAREGFDEQIIWILVDRSSKIDESWKEEWEFLV
jgi:hypothetical protein